MSYNDLSKKEKNYHNTYDIIEDIIDSLPFAIALVKDGHIKKINKKFLLVFKKTNKEQLIDKKIETLLPSLPKEIINNIINIKNIKGKFNYKSWCNGTKNPILIESTFKPLNNGYLFWIVKECIELELLAQLPIVVYSSSVKNPHYPSYISEQIKRMCGYEPKSFYESKNFWDSLIHPEDKDRVLAVLNRAKKEKSGWDISYRISRKEAGFLWIKDHAMPIKYHGKVVAIVGMLKDITKEKEIELALSEASLRHQLLFEKAPIGIIYVDRFGNIVDCNDQLAKIFGAPKEKFIGYNMLNASNMTLRFVAKKLLRGQENYYEGPYRSEISGRELQISVIATPLKNKEDNIIGGVCLVQDISKRVELEESLKREVLFKETILSTVQALVVVLDRNGRISHLNKTAEDKLGVRLEEVKDMPFWQVWVPSANINLAKKHFKEILKHSKPGSIEKELRTRNGKKLLVVWSYDLIKENGEIKWVVGTGIDITEQRKMEEQLRHAQKMEAIHRLAGGVAHELNNQLTAISGYIQMLKDRFKEDHIQKVFDSILRASAKAAETTNKLLLFSQYEDLSSKKLDINAYIRRIVNNLIKSLPAIISIKLDLAKEPLFIKANELRLFQIFDNLIKNSKDAMPNGGIIYIKTERLDKDHLIVVSVSDTGIGMGKDVIEKAFEPFFTTKPFGKGQGLGLSTVYGIVKQYGGHIKLESKKGKGTKVTIWFPPFDESE